MRARITNIVPIKKGTNDVEYQRVMFQLEDGSWAKTDLCLSYRNYAPWVPYLTIGTTVDNVFLRRPGEIDADSHPWLATQPLTPPLIVKKEEEKKENPQLDLF